VPDDSAEPDVPPVSDDDPADDVDVVGEPDEAGVWTERETTGNGAAPDETEGVLVSPFPGAAGAFLDPVGAFPDPVDAEPVVGLVSMDRLTIGRSVGTPVSPACPPVDPRPSSPIEPPVRSPAPMVGTLGEVPDAVPDAALVGVPVGVPGEVAVGLLGAVVRLTTGRSVAPVVVSVVGLGESVVGTGGSSASTPPSDDPPPDGAVGVGASVLVACKVAARWTGGSAGRSADDGDDVDPDDGVAGDSGVRATTMSGNEGSGRGSIGGSVTARDGGAGVTETDRWSTVAASSDDGRANRWTGGRSATGAGVARPVTSPEGASGVRAWARGARKRGS
jgi:hypothetical protein